MRHQHSNQPHHREGGLGNDGPRRGRTSDDFGTFDGDFSDGFDPRADGDGRGRGRGRGGRRGPGFGTGGMGRGPMGPGFETGGRGFGPFGFGPMGPMGGPGGRGRGRRARRGDVRQAILAVLSEGPSNGYGIIKAIEEHTGGVWRTSPGSVYPTLAQLSDEGLIAPVEGSSASGTEYELTEAGRTHVAENAEELAKVWAPAEQEWAEVGDLWVSARKLMEALKQVTINGTPEQREQLVSKMDELRREAYRLLSE
ncbi:PadR family transcriptional regulator [Salana multivorans]|uniref:PadR family transcriptional regulator n=1 Tax=Salana multivorans TaxID=120377 RepID=A0A3N2DAD9_9MICO|nr:PadR family transcriptional regulator [Salana multivorans]ROR96765.1 PadR family transcriptional regulator [Salana multivorans]